MLKKFSFGLLVTTLVFVAIIVIGVQVTAPQQPPQDSPSAKWLAVGPYESQQAEMLFIDSSRATNANGAFAGAPQRSLPSAIR